MKRLLTVGILLAVFVLGAASFAFFGDTFFSSASASDPGEMVREIAIEDVICDENDVCETIGGTVQIGLDEAEGLPEIAPDIEALFVSRDGDTITLGTGNISVEVSVEQVDDNEPVTAISAVHGGPTVDLMVTDATEVYFDTTEHQEPTREELAAGTMRIQRTVEAGDLGSLAQNTMVRAWGIMQDGVLVADVLVIEPIR